MTTETFTVWRDWGSDSAFEYAKTFDLTELQTMADSIGEDISSEEFTYFLTALNCDSYADSATEDLVETYNCYSYTDEEEYKYKNAFIRCMEQESFLTCWTVFRLWNINLTKEEALAAWERDSIATLEGSVD